MSTQTIAPKAARVNIFKGPNGEARVRVIRKDGRVTIIPTEHFVIAPRESDQLRARGIIPSEGITVGDQNPPNVSLMASETVGTLFEVRRTPSVDADGVVTDQITFVHRRPMSRGASHQLTNRLRDHLQRERLWAVEIRREISEYERETQPAEELQEEAFDHEAFAADFKRLMSHFGEQGQAWVRYQIVRAFCHTAWSNEGPSKAYYTEQRAQFKTWQQRHWQGTEIDLEERAARIERGRRARVELETFQQLQAVLGPLYAREISLLKGDEQSAARFAHIPDTWSPSSGDRMRAIRDEGKRSLIPQSEVEVSAAAAKRMAERARQDAELRARVAERKRQLVASADEWWIRNGLKVDQLQKVRAAYGDLQRRQDWQDRWTPSDDYDPQEVGDRDALEARAYRPEEAGGIYYDAPEE